MTLASAVAGTVAGRATRGMAPIYRPMRDGEAFDITVSEAALALGEFQHDIATISASTTETLDTATLLGSSISFFYGLAPRTEQFTGYITDVADDQNSTAGSALSFTMTILGATKDMQSGTPRFRTNTDIPNVVKHLSYKHSLGFHGHDHPFVWQSLAQTDETDWKFASDLAKRIGWSIFNRYGVVMCYNPLRLFTENGSFIDLISSQYNAVTGDDRERALLDFTPQEESIASLSNTGGKIAYFNNDRVQVATQKGEYTLFSYIPNTIIRSPEEADVYVNASASNTDSWKQQASARILGNANIFPGMSVDVHTTNPKYYKDRYNGRWLVRAVQHKMDRQQFQSQLILARPDSTTGISITPYVPFWTQANRARPTMSLSGNAVRLQPVNGLPVDPVQGSTTPVVVGDTAQVWVSSWADRRIRSVT